MTHYKVTLEYEGKNVRTVAKKAQEFFGGDAAVRVERVTNPTSRSDRLSDAESSVSSAREEVEMLQSELQDWSDNLPENLQGSEKADELQTAIDQLEEINNALDGIDWSVDFPGMF